MRVSSITITPDQLKLYDSVGAALFTDPLCFEPYWCTHRHFTYDTCILTVQDVLELLCEFYGFDGFDVTIEDMPNDVWDLSFSNYVWRIV